MIHLRMALLQELRSFHYRLVSSYREFSSYYCRLNCIFFCADDNRLGFMETGTAISRAMIHIMQNCKNNKKVHVINMSYGEPSHFSNSGYVRLSFFNLLFKVVNKSFNSFLKFIFAKLSVRIKSNTYYFSDVLVL